jgi:hypothetical protein
LETRYGGHPLNKSLNETSRHLVSARNKRRLFKKKTKYPALM